MGHKGEPSVGLVCDAECPLADGVDGLSSVIVPARIAQLSVMGPTKREFKSCKIHLSVSLDAGPL
jgi:hypothetical protein